jgi:hypothetical protein
MRVFGVRDASGYLEVGRMDNTLALIQVLGLETTGVKPNGSRKKLLRSVLRSRVGLLDDVRLPSGTPRRNHRGMIRFDESIDALVDQAEARNAAGRVYPSRDSRAKRPQYRKARVSVASIASGPSA